MTIISRLPNRDRGDAARGLYRVRKYIGNEAAFAGMMNAWDHDHAIALKAFGSAARFAQALRRVAPPHGRMQLVRAYRGVIVGRNVHPREAALGLVLEHQ